MNHFQTVLNLLVVTTLLFTSCKEKENKSTSETKGQSSQPTKTLVNYDPQGSIGSAPFSVTQDKAETDNKLFTRLAPAKTGVNFINPILKDNPRAYLYASAMGCGGISVGDVNGDGRPDLFFTGGPVPNQLLIR